MAAALALLLGGGFVLGERWGLLREGDEAPDFSGELSSGERIRLSDFRGKKHVVLSFYPKDFSPGCTSQACSYRDSYSRIKDLDGVIIGISSDAAGTHQRFADAYALPYPLITDADWSISKMYGSTRLGTRWLPRKRVTYVIDKEGIIRAVAHYEFAVDRHIERILGALENLTSRNQEKD